MAEQDEQRVQLAGIEEESAPELIERYLDSGNNARPGAPRGAPPQRTPAVDTQQAIQQGVNELNQLRREVWNDPEMER